jgi:hypothetical protein
MPYEGLHRQIKKVLMLQKVSAGSSFVARDFVNISMVGSQFQSF